MFRFCLQLICLPFVLLAFAPSESIIGRWDWIKSYQETIAGGHYITPDDLGYSMHIIIRNDSVFTYHNDTLVKSSFKSLIDGTIHSDTLAIVESILIDAARTSYWKKATTNTTSEKPPILFLCSRINYAWGHVHKGWFIDSSGDIRNYDFTNGDSIGYVGQSDTLPSKIYNQLFAKGVPTGKKVPIDTLLFMQTLIGPANNGIISLGHGCKDFGIFRYSVFMDPRIYENYGSRLKEIICYQIGDETACNSSSAAKKIARWLNSIDSADLRSCNPPDSCLNSPTFIAQEASLTKERPTLIRASGQDVIVAMAQSGTIIIRAYTLRGERLAKPFEQFMREGEHKIGLARILSGVQSKKPLIVEFSGSGIGGKTRTVIILQDR